MATIVGTLAVNVTARTKPFQQSLRSATQSINRFSASVARAAARAGALLAVGGAAGLGFAVKLAADAEKAEVQLTTMLRSAEKAREVLKDLTDFAAKTPFQLVDLRQGAIKLLAFGVSAEDLMERMKTLGDVAAGSGARLTELVSVFGKVRSSGIASLGDINQFGDRAIPIFQTLKTQLGLSGAELKKFISAGKLGFPELLKALESMTTAGGIFENAMEKLSKTLAGTFSTLKDNITNLLTEVGLVLLPTLANVTESALKVVMAFNSISRSTLRNVVNITAFVGALAAALIIIPRIISAVLAMIKVLRALAQAQAIATAFGGPKGWIVLAGSVVAAAVAMAAVDKAFASVTQGAVEAADGVEKLVDETQKLPEAMKQVGQIVDQVNPKLEAMFARGKQLAIEMRTPLEKYADTLRELQDLFFIGAIGQKTITRAIDKATADLKAATDSARRLSTISDRGVGAVTRGTTAAFTADQEAIRQSRRQVQLAEDDKREQEKQTEILTLIEEHAREGGIEILERRI